MPIYNPPLRTVDIKETRRYAGLSAADFSEQAIIAACNEMVYLAEPRGSWEMYNYDNIKGIVSASVPFRLQGSKILKHLSHSEKVILLSVTAGSNIETAIEKNFHEGSYTHGLLLDAAATAAVEQVADGLEKNIDISIKPLGYKRIWRFSPGYGDWDISCQPHMLRLTNASAIGIEYTSSMMLTPRKSVTAIIGLVPETDPFTPQRPSCATCPQKNCSSRIQ
ncbi:vitamin B12 dependent-methionine synthase activation domain-containing protein [Pectinatus haikarae]|uniref:AdoMet activation domain-containing protein n=1 Tax=Pectinatus haikarae TaxID=349096 RepID=A0ABT9Y694_9FIRM|nr:vitamin B12 dependent-methionine synthase activation domain-containing protein [Pectinatus haikarae]MDQ0203332.1 hypothetical protein [Pectinatus haikarae]